MKTTARLRAVLLLLLVLLVVLLPASAAFAKSLPDRIVVAGPGMVEPIEITDQASLSGFNPWTRGFIAWDRGPVAAPPPAEQTYTASFYLKNGDGARSLIFVLHYRPDSSGGPGYIYIPGPGDEWYRLNIGTIITGGSDHWNPNGKWQYATPAWDTVMRRALREHGVSLPVPDPPAPLARSNLPAAGSGAVGAVPTPAPASRLTRPVLKKQPWTVALLVAGLITGLASVAWLHLRQTANGATRR
ncbi:MAG: hypothetical protein HY332_10780 [Chloroflexi bacterium]|nr:hypothetical protein [Chloroflexota bacterium]